MMYSKYSDNPEYRFINEIKIYEFHDFNEVIDYAVNTKKICVALNSDKLTYCDDELRSIINDNIGYCDGIGAVWALKRKGFGKNTVKMPGCELWLKIIDRYPDKKYYLIGAEKEVIEKVVAKLKSEYSKIDIVGYRDGFIKKNIEKMNLFTDIKEKSPDFIFVAMGSPKQEYLLSEIQKFINIPMLGLGGSFNVYVEKVKRAPKWMLKLNLETLYRYIFCNIKWHRIKSDMKFIIKLIFNKI